ncbi:glycerophosphodiester phosphodiesterase family protein [Pyrofollis japonicus]|uniref:glycerophosphodiester phosphodiesterase family protein n=1 Tax=Pyrofollis japonicus TaxID=3060460 RepID=UPI00295A65EF|nr:glycerophosphodiester phosphodiesterase family protein [Pyrofollis japonicus]BEP18556.1 glycerophosphodiester phosphodiesterase family protein [Pyrofollis japonicus]
MVSETTPRILGHRGYPRRYPENTVASFLGAIVYGADGVELDVWLTSDNEVVVVHDRDLKRVAGVDKDVKTSSVSELKSIHVGMGQVVPTLREVLEAIPRGYEIFIEVKDVDAALPSLKIVNELQRREDVVIISFNVDVLEIIRSNDKGIRLGINIDSLEKAQLALNLVDELSLYSVNPPIDGIEIIGVKGFVNYLKAVRERGARTAIWTVNEPEKISNIVELVDYIMTDDPLLLRRYFQ